MSFFFVSPLSAAGFFEKKFWLSGPREMPACDYAPALDHIIGDFHTKEARFCISQLQIVGIENIRQIAVLPSSAQSILPPAFAVEWQ